MEVKNSKADEILKYNTEKQLIINDLAEYLSNRYGLKGIRYHNIWMKDQEFVKHFNKFGSMSL